MQNKKYISLLAVGLVATGLVISGAVFAKGGEGMMKPSLVGKVSVISGNIITVVSKQGINRDKTVAETVFAVDATNAKILRGETEINVSDIAVGDNVVVQGTITGSNVLATIIRDGKVGNGNENENENNQALLQIQGNGQPVMAGSVTAINGNTISITNKSNVSYVVTADANTKFVVPGVVSPTISNVAVGDNLIVQGAVNGAQVTASSIIDQKAKVNNPTANLANKKINQGFFGGLGGFFRRLFGF